MVQPCGEIAKRVYIGVCVGSGSVGRLQKRWIDTMKECLRKMGLDVRQTWRMVGVCERECIGHSLGYETLTLTTCQSYMKPSSVEVLSVAKSTT